MATSMKRRPPQLEKARPLRSRAWQAPRIARRAARIDDLTWRAWGSGGGRTAQGSRPDQGGHRDARNARHPRWWPRPSPPPGHRPRARRRRRRHHDGQPRQHRYPHRPGHCRPRAALRRRSRGRLAQGGWANIEALAFRPDARLGIVPSDTLDFLATFQSDPELRRRAERLRVVGPLHAEEVHVLARPGIATLADLGGKRVAVGAPDSSTLVTATLLLGTAASRQRRSCSSRMRRHSLRCARDRSTR